MQRVADDDWVAEIGEQLPVSPLSVLGLFLAAVIGTRLALEHLSTRTLLESVFPLAAATAVVFADRWLVARDVSARDRLTVFGYGLGGFLAAVLVTALHLFVLYLEGTGALAPLYCSSWVGQSASARGRLLASTRSDSGPRSAKPSARANGSSSSRASSATTCGIR
ncbi:integral membrane sensor signal transduction histidine kinase [Natrinema sp. 1APR25-10V2]|uniref:integral membrane sensor signal transduction histidine kinase n=1 Tax=Natrinema sp. 1APR25-10V2 TaxID=2951081 RepID=UPI00287417B2|nr:integral membrane sensor signal transduction histidine kinase [Natrinema sp. 1APR25-10V2]MDS0476576.1 integral membrane sensor signal transduction histidine kinase [Natrinema sp. 1APR25-10V2]